MSHNIEIYCVSFRELLEVAKVLLPIWRRKSEITREMNYAETKAVIYGAKVRKQCITSSLKYMIYLTGGQVKKFNNTIYSVNPSDLYDGEIFVDIDGSVVDGIYDYYQISNYGRVFHKYLNKFIKIAQDGSENGYYFFVASTENGPRPVSVHRIELMCFNPNPYCNQLQVNHIDGNPHNNHISNLEWCTRSENVKHAYRIGLQSIGEDNSLSEITTETALRICELLQFGKFTNEEIAIIVGHGATTSIVSDIKQGKSWAHISQFYEFISRPGRLFTDDQLHNLCKYFESHNIGNICINDHCRNALAFCGYNNSDRYVDTVRKLYSKRYFKSISCNYNF